jgi:hypothetical protein
MAHHTDLPPCKEQKRNYWLQALTVSPNGYCNGGEDSTLGCSLFAVIELETDRFL